MTYFRTILSAALLALIHSAAAHGWQDGEGLEAAGKQALDGSGNPVTSALTGETITYALSYPAPLPDADGGVAVTDTLSPNQSYVPDSLQMPPGWAVDSTPPYANANTATYTHDGGAGSNLSFEMTVSAGAAVGAASSGGDGTVPIPVTGLSGGTRIYGIHHHKGGTEGTAKLMCWDPLTLERCEGFASGSRSLDPSPDQALYTSIYVRGAVHNQRIYFPSGYYEADRNRTIFGLGCWDAAAESPCPFIPFDTETAYVDGQISSGLKFSHFVAGAIGDPNASNRIFAFSSDHTETDGRVYCIDVNSGSSCTGWSETILNFDEASSIYSLDMISGQPSDRRLFVQHSFSGSNSSLSCIDLDTGSSCWNSSVTLTGGPWGSLSPYLDSAGEMTHVCAHRFVGSMHQCHSVDDGTELSTPSAFAAVIAYNSWNYLAYQVPGTARVFYAHFSAGIACFDFATGAACSSFTPGWPPLPLPTGNSVNPKDYGYVQQPDNPACFFGLGDSGRLWRFHETGALDHADCDPPSTLTAVYSLSDYFCAALPGEAEWDRVVIHDRPSELSGGTIRLLDSDGSEIWSASVGSSDSYPVGAAALGAGSEVTLEFTPQYSGEPAGSYTLELVFTADANPQICYQATIGECGPVWNEAVFQAGNQSVVTQTDLGEATGPGCAGPNCFEAEAAFDADTGVLDLTIDPPGGFAGGRLALRALSDTVVIWPQFQTLPPGQTASQWSVQGLQPGDSVFVQADLVMTGAGHTPGTDLCCSSLFEIEVPEPETQIDLAIEKTGHNFAGPHGEYTLNVTNAGPEVTLAGGAVTVTDTVPADMSFLTAGGPDWDCGDESQFPLEPGDVLTCHSGGALSAGASLPAITISVFGDPDTLAETENCAQVSVGGDTDLSNNEDCWSGSTDNLDRDPPEAEITVRKVRVNADFPCAPIEGQENCLFTVTVNVDNPGPGSVDVLIGDEVFGANGSPASVGLDVALQQGPEPFCNPASGASPLACTISVDPGSHSFQYSIRVRGAAPGVPLSQGEYLNCFTALQWSGAVPANLSDTGIEIADSGEQWMSHGVACAAFAVAGSVDTRPDEPPRPQCDLASTYADGGACVCRNPTLTQISPTACACPQGTEMGPAGRCATPVPQRPQCDLATTYADGGECICRNPTLAPVSPTACACPPGTEMGPAGRCERPEPAAPACDAATTVLDGGQCVCREPARMTQVSATECSCPPRHAFNPNADQCVPLFCSPPLQLNAERTECVCPDGQTLVDGQCQRDGPDVRFSIDAGPARPRPGRGGRPDGPDQPDPNRGRDPNCIPGGPVPCR